ncbi:Uncharacterised protein [Yersinia aleksiciae]|uniref:Uncharacterized protein n=1 Tax=Yersinia aleksiciae TaxID=263819 RepID=A0A0T9TJ16_YERAE|nr:Uncharacterised protein [Yersinia aleksiciae]
MPFFASTAGVEAACSVLLTSKANTAKGLFHFLKSILTPVISCLSGITQSFLSGSLKSLLMECAKHTLVIINSRINCYSS